MAESNYYAGRVFAEHPLVLWPLDESLTYVSMFQYTDQDDMTGWSTTNMLSVDLAATIPPGAPLDADTFYAVVDDETQVGIIETATAFTQTSATPLGVSIYAVSLSGLVQSYEIGIRYTSGAHVGQEDKTVFSGTVAGNWQRAYHSCTPYENEAFVVYVKVEFLPDIGAATPDFYLNGLAGGELSENFNSKSFGINPQAVPLELQTVIDPLSYSVYPALPYGLDEENIGYYTVVETGSFNGTYALAKNNGIPLVYGAANVSAVYKSGDGTPSIVIPGNGFLHSLGQYNNATFEFWCTQGYIDEDISTVPGQMTRFFGPVDSTDGLYRDDTHVYLKVDDNIRGYAVNNWYRPILFSFRYSVSGAALSINGETVIDLPFSAVDLTLSSGLNWLGFYNSALSVFEVDSVAMYPYLVPPDMSKRRYAIGQGVPELNTIESTYLGRSITFDYTRSKYDVNAIYPDSFRWNTGFMTNFKERDYRLEYPRYSLPTYTHYTLDANDNRTYVSRKEWLGYLYDIGSSVPYFTFRPDLDGVQTGTGETYNGVSGVGGRLLWSKINELIDGTHAMAFDFQLRDTTDQEIFRLENPISEDFVTLYVESGDFVLSYNDLETIWSTTATTSRRSIALVFNNIADAGSVDVQSFFSNVFLLSLVTGGDSSFNGKIYGVQFYDEFQFNQDYSSNLTDTVVLTSPTGETAVASYTYRPTSLVGSIVEDVWSKAYWQDALPLAHFAKFDGDRYRLDIMQINTHIDSVIGSELLDKTLVTVDFKMSEDFDTLNTKNYFDTVVDAGGYLDLTQNDIYSTLYIIHDGTVIYFPNDMDIENTFIWFRIRGTSNGVYTRPTFISRLEASSMTYASDESGFASIGTRFNVDVYPFKMAGVAYLPADKNPIRITKMTGPYLYQTDQHGIGLVATDENLTEGVAVPVNNRAASYKLAGLKFWVKLDESFFDLTDKNRTIASLKMYKSTGNEIIEVRVADENGRYAIELYQDGELYPLAKLYQESTPVEKPYLERGRWSHISIAFANYHELTAVSYFNLFPGAVYQNISFHEAWEVAIGDRAYYRSWYGVKYPPGYEEPAPWSYWDDLIVDGHNAYWSDVLYSQAALNYYFEAENLVDSIFGTIAIVSDAAGTGAGIGIQEDSMTFYMEPVWSNYSGTPI